MEWIDFVSFYVYFLRIFLLVAALFIAISSLDDIFIDLCYWWLIFYRWAFIRKKYKPLDVEQLYVKEEKPLAVMVPAWQEEAVIRQMVENTVRTYDYKNYKIFIGVYRNDPATQAAAKSAAKNYPQVEIVTVPNDGPTCKADCLNWLLQGIILYEKNSGTPFSGVVMHDAEDVVHRFELKLFNYLIDRIDFMQLPVFSLEVPWNKLVAGHYLDEFAESHSKELLVREMLIGQVPSAGVATCISRRAIDGLVRKNENLVFNTDSLTEDYDLGFRIKELGMKQIFLRYGIMATVRLTSPFTGRVRTVRQIDYVATREYFPDSIRASVRQKARWIVGIAFQGWAFVGWRGNILTRYMLLRDRKVMLTAILACAAYFLFVNLIILKIMSWLFPDTYAFPTLVETWTFLWWLIIFNISFLLNRIAHRILFTSKIYGWEQGLLSIPRIVVSNIICFLAVFRATRIYATHLLTGARLTWEKTFHVYPSADQLQQMRQRLGEFLLERKLITEFAINEALQRQKTEKRPLGELLLEMNLIPIAELSQALAQHLGVSVEKSMALLQKNTEQKQ